MIYLELETTIITYCNTRKCNFGEIYWIFDYRSGLIFLKKVLFWNFGYEDDQIIIQTIYHCVGYIFLQILVLILWRQSENWPYREQNIHFSVFSLHMPLFQNTLIFTLYSLIYITKKFISPIYSIFGIRNHHQTFCRP